MIYTGWWFGTWFLWLSINLCECHHPDWRTHIFQRGRLNHQPAYIYWNLGIETTLIIPDPQLLAFFKLFFFRMVIPRGEQSWTGLDFMRSWVNITVYPSNIPLTSTSTSQSYHSIHIPWSMDWFKGKSTGNHRFSYEIRGFPIIFPLNQSIDCNIPTIQLSPNSPHGSMDCTAWIR